VVGESSAGVQWAAEGEKTAGGAASATIVQRQWVRVGAADVVVVERRRVVARSEDADVKSIFVVCCGFAQEVCWVLIEDVADGCGRAKVRF
jgi:hypothetical protein